MKTSKTPWPICELSGGLGEALIVDADGNPICGPVMFLGDAKEIVRAVNVAVAARLGLLDSKKGR